jgi:hypothetical protein
MKWENFRVEVLVVVLSNCQARGGDAMAKVKYNELPDQTREFVRMVEHLLDKRQEEEDQKRTGRKWNLKTIIDEYPEYSGLRRGKVQRPPPRDEILRLGDILHCSIEELNLLLVSAEYGKLQHYLQDEELERVLMLAQPILRYLHLPSMVIGRDFNIWRWNRYLPGLFGLTEQDFRRTPDTDRNLLRYIFDPQTPIFRLLREDTDRWEHIARLVIFWFKSHNMSCRRASRYIALVEKFKRDYLGFEKIWDSVDLDYKPTGDVSRTMPYEQYIIEFPTPDGKYLRLRQLQIQYFDKSYPRIISYMPENNDAHGIFKQLGVPSIGNFHRDLRA